MFPLRLAATTLRISLINEFQYRANFFVSLLETAISLAVALGGLALVFSHTDALAGWQGWELLVLIGVYYIMGALIETFIQPSMEALLGHVRKGTLDFTLTKPVDAQLLLSVRGFRVWSLVNLLLGIGLIVWGMGRGNASVGWQDAGGFALMLVAGAVIVYSFWLMLATVAFWFVRMDNILVIFQSMYEAGRWPVAIYPPALRVILTFVVPVAFAVTMPTQALVGRATLQTVGGALLLATAICIFARWFWLTGLRRYSGASA